MTSSFWNGSIRFGQVVVPVGLTPARTDGDPAFVNLHRDCATKLKRVPGESGGLVCPEHGDVPVDERCKGFEVAAGQYVTVEQAELDAIAPAEQRSIDVFACVPTGEIDRAATEASYYLLPSEAPIGRKGYLLLAGALRKTNTVALARLVHRQTEWLASIRPHGDRGALILERLAFADDLISAAEVEKQLAGVAEPTSEEAQLAIDLVATLSPVRLPRKLLLSEHRARVQQLIEAKLAGEPLLERRQHAEVQGGELPSVDLTDALRRSLQRTRPARRQGQSKPRARAGTAKR